MSTSTKTIHLVPSFHYDIEYLLTEGAYLEICYEILLEAHRLLSKYPDYTYRVEQVFLLEKFFQEYPSLQDDFRRFAGEGRFEVAAGMYSMGDINMSSGESILRQLITGKTWCQKNLNLTPRVLDMGDCTGHPASMPQIAKTCGYDYFTFERAIDDVNRKCEIRWKGIDGTELSTYWLAIDGYGGWGYLPSSEANEQQLADICRRTDHHCLSNACIVAHGGDFRYPCEKAIAFVNNWNETHDVKVLYSTYEKGLNTADFSKAPVETCEWNPDRQGCYSSRIRIKQGNRECESLIFTTEAVSSLANRLWGTPTDHDGLERAWKLLFVNQFHDIYWGTICDQAYHHALERISRIRMICRNIIEDRLRPAVAGSSGGLRKVAVFNPLPWPRKHWIEIPVDPLTEKITIIGPNGENIEPQRKSDRVLWPAQLPPCGLSVFSVHQQQASKVPLNVIPVPGENSYFKTGSVLINDHPGLEVETPLYRVRFSPGGSIAYLQDKRNRLEFTDPLNVLCYQSDRGDLWQYYEGPLRDGGPFGPAQDNIDDPYPLTPVMTKNGRRYHLDVLDNRSWPQAEFCVEEISGCRLVIGIKGTLNRKFPAFREFENESIRIDWQQRVTFYADDPQIDFHLETRHVAGKWYRLRAAFFSGIKNGAIRHEIPFGSFSRPEGEFAVQNYLAYSNEGKGLVLLNQGLPGNNVTDGVMMLSLMRSVNIHTRAETDQAFELGQEHAFDYALLPFAGEKELNNLHPARRGLEFNRQPYIFDSRSNHNQDRFRLPPNLKKSIPEKQSLFELKSDSLICSAIIPAEGKIILRLYESQGRSSVARVSFNFFAATAAETSATLDHQTPLSITGNELILQFKPFEIKTLVVT